MLFKIYYRIFLCLYIYSFFWNTYFNSAEITCTVLPTLRKKLLRKYQNLYSVLIYPELTLVTVLKCCHVIIALLAIKKKAI